MRNATRITSSYQVCWSRSTSFNDPYNNNYMSGITKIFLQVQSQLASGVQSSQFLANFAARGSLLSYRLLPATLFAVSWNNLNSYYAWWCLSYNDSPLFFPKTAHRHSLLELSQTTCRRMHQTQQTQQLELTATEVKISKWRKRFTSIYLCLQACVSSTSRYLADMRNTNNHHPPEQHMTQIK